MRKILLLFLLFQYSVTFSQESERITISFNNNTLKEAINKIENTSNYHFFYDESWFSNVLITQEFEDKKIEEILTSIFEKSILNFHIDNHNVILIKNKAIHSNVENTFYNSTDTKTLNKNEINQKDEDIVYIGKEENQIIKSEFTLKGSIKNIKTNSPISQATISIINQSRSKTTADSEGKFEIQVKLGANIIEVEADGFKRFTQKLIIYDNGEFNISLLERTNTLNEVVIKRKRKSKIKTTIVGVTTLQSEGIKNIPVVLGERDIFKIATTLPGIKTAGEGSSGYNVRGGKEDQNLFLLDNSTIYNPTHFFGFFSAINPYITKEVNIYKASIPVEYGGRLSSVFEVNSKNGDTKKFKGEGGIGPVTSNLTFSTPIKKDKSSLYFGARGTYSDWILKSLNNKQLKNSRANFYDIFTKYYHEINKNNSVELMIYNSSDKYSITSDSLYSYKNLVGALKWNHIFNAKNKIELHYNYTKYDFKIDYDSPTDIFNSYTFKYNISEHYFQAKTTYEPNPKNLITYGVSSKLYQLEPGNLSPYNTNSNITEKSLQSEKALESSIFLSDNLKFGKNLSINFGGRFSQFAILGESTQRNYLDNQPITSDSFLNTTTYKSNEIVKLYYGIEPRFALHYKFNETLSFKIGVDRNVQYVHLLTNNTTQSPTDTWKLSDINIKPQQSIQYSIGIFKNLAYYDLEFSIEGYYKKMDNILDYRTGAKLFLNDKIETETLQGEGKAYGVEFLIKKTEGKLNGWLSYTYSRALIKFDSYFAENRINNGEFFSANFDKPHDLSLILNYKFTKRYSFSSNFTYQTGRPITYPIGKFTYNNIEYTYYSDRNKFRIPDYYRLDIGVNIEGNHKIKKLSHSFWSVSVYNLLGRNNPYSVFFVTEEGKVKGYKTSIFGNPIPTITYNFKF